MIGNFLKPFFNLFKKTTPKSNDSNRELYIGNIHYNAKPYELRKFFEEFGDIESLKIIRDPKTKRSKGYGFVKFYKQADAEKALKYSNTKDFKGRELCVAFSKN